MVWMQSIKSLTYNFSGEYSLKKIKWCSIALLLVMVLQCAGLHAWAATLSEASSFEFTVKKVEDTSAPGNMLVEMYCKSAPNAAITTLGATIVFNTDYIDIVNKKGEATTDTYKKEMSTLGKSSTVAAASSGGEDPEFSGFRGLSIASYNESSKQMYVFLCGMANDANNGVNLAQKTKVATLYLKTKAEGKLPAGAIRLCKQAEIGKDCPAKAVFVTEISSKTEIGKGVSPIQLSVDEALMDGGEAPTETEPATKQKETEKTTKETKTTTAAPATKPVSEMSEAQVESELQQRVAAAKAVDFTPEQKQSAFYKAYEKAVEEAEAVLADKNATPEQKQQALENLRKAQEALEKEFPEVAEKLEAPAKTGESKWLIIGICAAVAALAAVIVVILLKNKKKKSL